MIWFTDDELDAILATAKPYSHTEYTWSSFGNDVSRVAGGYLPDELGKLIAGVPERHGYVYYSPEDAMDALRAAVNAYKVQRDSSSTPNGAP